MTTTKDISIKLQGLSVLMGRRAILRDINLVVARGESIAIMGPNGAGKSTLLSCLAGAIRPACGEICCFGKVSPHSVVAKRLTGFTAHESGLYAELTALENLVFAARMYGVDAPVERAQSALIDAALSPLADVRVGQLSRGMQQRLAIIRATIHRPALILLDEPFASLDSDGTKWLELLFQTWRGTTQAVCFASHNIEQSRRLADRIVWLESGQISSIDKYTCIAAHSLKVA